jgi:hypothetical protein
MIANSSRFAISHFLEIKDAIEMRADACKFATDELNRERSCGLRRRMGQSLKPRQGDSIAIRYVFEAGQIPL